MMAVSYTHLDVYKRQHLGYAHGMVTIDVAEIFLAGPQHLDRSAAEGLRDRYGLLQLAVHSSPAKPAALEAVVHEYIGGGQSGELRRRQRRVIRNLRTNPDLRPVGGCLLYTSRCV